ncbi:hypothetical protein BV210_07320 [Halorientalis sp. IM1011]|uniref:DUF4129 domain-containing protein n=1 Tax=Halorientalis sp. IM1011 TaxID=1932360 RepID=UPI00097CD63A|nr:DUF4129 domain-containing protein [Halorientalis sp. IM1011]AQL42531.1 hypothetical protein BV210_07320 [Halorientalis sp. IM1011]
MQRRPLFVALVALSAALAFGVGATAVADLDSPSVTSGPVNTTNESANASAGGGAGGGGPGGVDPFGSVGGIYGLVAGLLPTVPPALLLILTALVVAALALAGLRHRRDGTDRPPEPEVSVDPERGRDDATGASAAISDAPPTDNDVYRAWRAMVSELDVTYGETTTPREFAREAVEAGADSAAVERLTDLFDRVRYGAVEPTEERERAARDALAAVEDGDAE